MSQPARRFSLFAVAVVLAGAFVGGMFGGGALADPQRTDDQLFTFGRVLSLVESNSVGNPDSEELIEGAIEGLLHTLDPHSNYLDAETFSEMRDEQRGKFSGLGIQITKRGPDKPLTIIAPIDDTPAYRAGLRSGDVISHIEGEPTIDLTVHEAVRLLKGERGSRVTITIERPRLAEPFDVTIERDDIPIDSIRVAHLVTPEIGYVRISNFTSTTADELDRAVAGLAEKGVTKLLLDLRGNPGGLLEQAVQVSERFIPAGELVVYTRGRIPGSNHDYVAKRGVDRIEMPLVVLVDESSASASEIVSGAVQDHDRGLVVGETTFGKGLVQRVIPLESGGALAVTTAKYYTPAGRLIQRDYTDLEAYYLERGEDEFEGEVPREGDATDDDEGREVFHTDAGRKVYGGGGIRPDHVVKSIDPPSVLLDLIRENMLFDYAVTYNALHEELAASVPMDDATWQDFKRYLGTREFEFDAAELDEARDAVQVRLRAQVARVRWDQNAESAILMAADPQVQTALGLFGDAERLADRGARVRSELRAQANEPQR